MSFSTDMAGLVAEQLSRFVTLNRHQLAGQVANLDFWLAEVRHALAVIDGYGVRFIRLEAGQQHCAANALSKLVNDPISEHLVEQKMPPPRRIPDRELQKARRALLEAATALLDRCEREGLLTQQQLDSSLRSMGISPS